MYHEEVARAESRVEPVGLAQAGGEVTKPVADAVVDQVLALRRPGLVALEELGDLQLHDGRLDGCKGGEHPGDGPSAGVRVGWQQPPVALGDVKHDGARLEEPQAALLVGGDLAEGMKPEMRGPLHRLERDQADVVGPAYLLERPAHAHVARLALALVG